APSRQSARRERLLRSVSRPGSWCPWHRRAAKCGIQGQPVAGQGGWHDRTWRLPDKKTGENKRASIANKYHLLISVVFFLPQLVFCALVHKFAQIKAK